MLWFYKFIKQCFIFSKSKLNSKTALTDLQFYWIFPIQKTTELLLDGKYMVTSGNGQYSIGFKEKINVVRCENDVL